MNTPLFIASIALALLTSGCVAKKPYPTEWNAHSPASEWCTTPNGAFANNPSLSTTTSVGINGDSLQLKEVFFGDQLNGFEITHLTFLVADTNTVVIKPWIGEQVLKEERRLERIRCHEGIWRLSSKWEPMPGAAVSGILWTGGIIIPMAANAKYSLALTDTGDLTVHASVHTSGTTFIFFPMRTRDADEWFHYPRIPAAESPINESADQES